MGFWAHVPYLLSFLGLSIMGKGPHLFAEPMFSSLASMGLLAIDPTISLYRTCYSFTFPFTSYYLVNLWVDVFAVPAHFFSNLLLRASLAHFPHLYLFRALLANIPTVSAYFTTLVLGLPRPIYFFFTFFTPMSFLLDSLDFLGPITTSLPLITFRAYWPLS